MRRVTPVRIDSFTRGDADASDARIHAGDGRGSCRVDRSGMPEGGEGLFSTVPMGKGSYVTQYPGRMRDGPLQDDDIYVVQLKNGTYLDAAGPFEAFDELYKKGIAHKVNDAFWPVSKIRPNCVFEDVGDRLYLKTTRGIALGEEFLVSYPTLAYFMRKPDRAPPAYREFILSQRDLMDAILRAMNRKRHLRLQSCDLMLCDIGDSHGPHSIYNVEASVACCGAIGCTCAATHEDDDYLYRTWRISSTKTRTEVKCVGCDTGGFEM